MIYWFKSISNENDTLLQSAIPFTLIFITSLLFLVRCKCSIAHAQTLVFPFHVDASPSCHPDIIRQKPMGKLHGMAVTNHWSTIGYHDVLSWLHCWASLMFQLLGVFLTLKRGWFGLRADNVQCSYYLDSWRRCVVGCIKTSSEYLMYLNMSYIKF